MNVVGLITEYNPLHNGHVYHYEQARKHTQAEATVVVMSGNFLQRGEPALVNKWARTKMALQMGADLVIELPYVYATQQAQMFAYGAISILDKLPFVTHVCFGSESGHIEPFEQIAQKISCEPESFKQHLQEGLKSGISYPQAYGQSLQKLLKDQVSPSFFKQPNNILGLHYVMAIRQGNHSLQACTIQRQKADYHDQSFSDSHIASATSIRRALFQSSTPDWTSIENYIPAYTLHILQEEHNKGRGPVQWEDYAPFIIHTLLSHSEQQLRDIFEIEEGIEYRMRSSAEAAQSVQQLIQFIKSKRYTWNRIQRMLLHTYTQLTKSDVRQFALQQGSPYIKLLGFSRTGQQLLNVHKDNIKVPLISSIKKDQHPLLDFELKAALLHALAYESKERIQAKKRELLQFPLHTDQC